MQKAITMAACLLLLPAAGHASVTTSVRQLAETTCDRRTTLSLEEHTYDASPEERTSPTLVVLTLDRTQDSGGHQERIWQSAFNSLKGGYPEALWAGTLLCGPGSKHAWLFTVVSAGIDFGVRVYSIDLASMAGAELPNPEMMTKAMIISEKATARPLTSLDWEVEACNLDRVEATWEKEDVLLTLGHGSKGCDSFQVHFNPTKGRFTNLPKAWLRIRAKSS